MANKEISPAVRDFLKARATGEYPDGEIPLPAKMLEDREEWREYVLSRNTDSPKETSIAASERKAFELSANSANRQHGQTFMVRHQLLVIVSCAIGGIVGGAVLVAIATNGIVIGSVIILCLPVGMWIGTRIWKFVRSMVRRLKLFKKSERSSTKVDID